MINGRENVPCFSNFSDLLQRSGEWVSGETNHFVDCRVFVQKREGMLCSPEIIDIAAAPATREKSPHFRLRYE